MKQLYNNRVLTTFMVLQPIIDIITGVMMYHFDLSLSLGMIIRFLFIIYAGIYILKNKDKKIITYIILWSLYFIISIVGNYFIKDSFNIITQIKNLVHMAYFPVTLLFFYLYLKKHKSLDNHTFVKMAIIIGVSLVLSIITNTSFCSYENAENCLIKGYVGWFNSANEYGIILISLLGFTMIEFLKKHKLINFIALILTVLFLCLLGTKTSFIGLVVLLGGYILYYSITTFIKKDKKSNMKYVGVFLIILLAVGISLKRLPIYYNLVGMYNETIKNNLNLSIEELQEEVTDRLVFNGRDDFIVINKNIYLNAPIFNKMFGITTQGNYYKGIPYDHINERDFHDLYMYYGIVGFILEMLLPLSLFISFIKKVVNNKNILLDDEIVILGITLGLILLVSFMAGHCLFQPAVAIYLAYIAVTLVKKSGKVL